MTNGVVLFDAAAGELSVVSFFATDGSSACIACLHLQLYGNPGLIMDDIHAVGGREVAGEPIKVFLKLC